MKLYSLFESLQVDPQISTDYLMAEDTSGYAFLLKIVSGNDHVSNSYFWMEDKGDRMSPRIAVCFGSIQARFVESRIWLPRESELVSDPSQKDFNWSKPSVVIIFNVSTVFRWPMLCLRSHERWIQDPVDSGSSCRLPFFIQAMHRCVSPPNFQFLMSIE